MTTQGEAPRFVRPRLHREVVGSPQGEPLVLLHALGCDHHLWDAVAPRMPREWGVLRYDLRGHGNSEAGPAECSIEDHARDLEGLLAEHVAQPATLVGVSVGGMIAMKAALLWPDRVRRLVLCATTGRIGSVESWNERIRAVQAQGLEGMAETILARWFAPGFVQREPSLHRRARESLLGTSTAGYLATCVALRDADLRSQLHRIRCPVLVLSGEHDVATPPAQGRELAAAIPGARFELIPGAAHLPPLERPEIFNAAVERFLKETA